MQISYREKSGTGWLRRSLAAIAMILAVAVAVWVVNGQVPTFISTVTLVIAPNGADDTAKFFAKSITHPRFIERFRSAAAAVITAEKKQHFYHYLQYSQLPKIEEWQKLLPTFFQRRISSDGRQWEIILQYPNFGEPEQSKLLQLLLTLMISESEKITTAANEKFMEQRQQEITNIDREIAQLRPDELHQKQSAAVLQMLKQTERGAPLLPAWQNAWRDYPELQPYLSEFANRWKAWQESCVRVDQQQQQVSELSTWITQPTNQTITQKVLRVVYHEDSPELIKLKDRKAALEATRMRLLLRATPLHPAARKLAEEIDELNAQINALTRLPHEVEDVETRTNPQLIIWRRELVAQTGELESVKLAENYAREQWQNALSALAQADREITHAEWERKKSTLQTRRAEIIAQPIPVATAPFTVYESPTPAQKISAKNSLLIYVLGGSIGLFLALLLLFGRRRTEFLYAETPLPPPAYPVLGSVPDFRALAARE